MRLKTHSHSASRSPSWRANTRHNDGMALVFVLWIVVLLSAVAFEMTFKGHLRAQITAATGDTTKAFFLARAGVEKSLADLASMDSTLEAQFEMREDGEFLYRNIELGEGSYTLYAGEDEDGTLMYGLIDESSKLNINKVDATILGKLPGIDGEVAAAIAAFKEDNPFHDIEDLLLIEGLNRVTLYGEDQNGNGILDPNEDDGDQSWPRDNSDGKLERGLAEYLTTWSVSREVTAAGEDRVDISSASAEYISNTIDDISLQQAQSIVAHRGNSEFSSVLDLYDVELVEQIQQSTEGPGGSQSQNQLLRGEIGIRVEGAPVELRPGNEPSRDESDEQRPAPGDSAENRNNGQNPEDQNAGAQPTTRGTGRKAFEDDAILRIADLVTIQSEAVTQGLVNINTASADVIACLPGMDESIALAIVTERQGRDGGFTTVMDLLSVNGISKDILKSLYNHVAVRSDVFKVRSFGVLRSGSTHVSVSAIIDRSGYTARILYWQEHE